MARDETFASPPASKVVLSFVIGIVVGGAIVLPAIRDELTLTILDNPDPVGNIVMIGVLAILVVSTGLFGLIRLFLLVDK